MIDNRLDHAGRLAVILRLHVENACRNLHIRIESQSHVIARRFIYHRKLQKKFASAFDQNVPTRYYISARKMNGSYLDAYAPLLLMFLLAAGLAGVLIIASSVVGRHLKSRAKDQPYECGIRPTGDAREPFPVHFYMVAMIFILFDIEAIFLYPWAIVFKQLNLFGFVEMLLYIVILVVGYIYLWKKGALEWK
ncbi:MAG TPA: NADH-quinone oxidoreductase subunit A [Candidatus Acidoferrales bacterium]|nr:NADH-quinone oxidoreductase subunit A [Candidatus Acidoferrales bacterium]